MYFNFFLSSNFNVFLESVNVEPHHKLTKHVDGWRLVKEKAIPFWKSNGEPSRSVGS